MANISKSGKTFGGPCSRRGARRMAASTRTPSGAPWTPSRACRCRLSSPRVVLHWSFFVCGSPRQLTDHMPNTRNGVLLCFHCCDRSKPPITCRTGCTATVVRKSRVRKGSRTTTPDLSSGRCTCEHHFQESGVPLSNRRLWKHGSP